MKKIDDNNAKEMKIVYFKIIYQRINIQQEKLKMAKFESVLMNNNNKFIGNLHFLLKKEF